MNFTLTSVHEALRNAVERMESVALRDGSDTLAFREADLVYSLGRLLEDGQLSGGKPLWIAFEHEIYIDLLTPSNERCDITLVDNTATYDPSKDQSSGTIEYGLLEAKMSGLKVRKQRATPQYPLNAASFLSEQRKDFAKLAQRTLSRERPTSPYHRAWVWLHQATEFADPLALSGSLSNLAGAWSTPLPALAVAPLLEQATQPIATIPGLFRAIHVQAPDNLVTLRAPIPSRTSGISSFGAMIMTCIVPSTAESDISQ